MPNNAAKQTHAEAIIVATRQNMVLGDAKDLARLEEGLVAEEAELAARNLSWAITELRYPKTLPTRLELSGKNTTNRWHLFDLVKRWGFRH